MTPLARRELLPGVLDMLILQTLTGGPMHGYGIARQIEQLSREVLRIEEGSLYPALQRMRQKRWVSASWGQTPNNQRARYYTLTDLGRRQLAAEASRFEELWSAIGRVMKPAKG
ncbi:MAG: PadR family transcriptional regulator [Gemmatimonadales bacterium]